MPSVATSPGRMETFARALDRAVASGVVPRLRIDDLCSAFIATDAQGRSWTIDLGSHSWRRLDGERWIAEEPPSQLFMDSEVRGSLTALEAMTARAIMTGTDAMDGPRLCWFRAAGSTAEPTTTWASRGSGTTPQRPLGREEPARVTDPAGSSESMSPPVSAPREMTPARATTEDDVIKSAWMAPLMSKVFGTEPAKRASVETTPTPEMSTVPVVTPTRLSSVAIEPEASASHFAPRSAAPVVERAPVIPEAPQEALPARPLPENPIVELAPMASVATPEISVAAEPAVLAPVETTLVPEPVPMLTLTPIRLSSVAIEPEASATAQVATPSAAPVVERVLAIPEAPRETPPARPLPENPVVELAPMASVASPEISGAAAPAAHAPVETTLVPEPVPMVAVTPIREPSIATKPEVPVTSRVTMPPAAPVEETAPPRPPMPEAHRRFAGPFAPALDDASTSAQVVVAARAALPAPDLVPAFAGSPAPMPPRNGGHDQERWVPTSIAPRLTVVHSEARDDRAHVYLCGLLAALFFALGVWKGDALGYAAALLFGLLAVALLVLNLAGSRDD